MTLRSEEEVDSMIADMIRRNKGKYITQGVSFNKTCPRQMDLLKKSLMSSVSFSGLAKEMLALRFEKKVEGFDTPRIIVGGMGQGRVNHSTPAIPAIPQETKEEKPKNKNYGNFI